MHDARAGDGRAASDRARPCAIDRSERPAGRAMQYCECVYLASPPSFAGLGFKEAGDRSSRSIGAASSMPPWSDRSIDVLTS